mmetsp:Transcript_50942/g.101305  ORF Transcript_50942/g.101305 Transcript_50942/m.101305 type:complete len:226 (+) Transcript_50942:171-848(+)
MQVQAAFRGPWTKADGWRYKQVMVSHTFAPCTMGSSPMCACSVLAPLVVYYALVGLTNWRFYLGVASDWLPGCTPAHLLLAHCVAPDTLLSVPSTRPSPLTNAPASSPGHDLNLLFLARHNLVAAGSLLGWVIETRAHVSVRLEAVDLLVVLEDRVHLSTVVLAALSVVETGLATLSARPHGLLACPVVGDLFRPQPRRHIIVCAPQPGDHPDVPVLCRLLGAAM